MNLEKEKRAIQYLQSFEPQEEPYYLCYSGGKDSDVIRIRTFDRMLEARKERGLVNRISWRNGKDVMKWWVGDDPLQISMFDEDIGLV